MPLRYLGLLIAVLLFCQGVLAQAEGVVESFGFQGYYRPDCWVPVTVRLRPTSDAPADLQIRVIQEDLDRDRVVAVRNITLTPDITGRNTGELFWMYFRPQPTDGGLDDTAVGGSPRILDQQLKVLLTTPAGDTVARLPNTQQNIRRIDVEPGGLSRQTPPKGVRMVLVVTDGTSLPAGHEYVGLEGLTEMPLFVSVRPSDLPEDVRGYEMVDAILWMGAQAPDPTRSTQEPLFRAIEQYVRQGGSLAICQSPEITRTRGFDSIIPVQLIEHRSTSELNPLTQITGLRWDTPPADATQPRRVAYAKLRPDALLVYSKVWENGESTPWLARRPLGAGCVTWVAQDLGEASLVRLLRGHWPAVYDQIMAWRNDPVAPDPKAEENQIITAYSSPYTHAGDVGAALRTGGALSLRASGYVLTAIIFCGIYWAIAGPGLYAWLTSRKLASLNWFFFGLAAMAGALLAWVVVRVIQSASPQLQHVTLVRSVPGEEATVHSRIGLYIPSDGLKELSLSSDTSASSGWITPYPEHPYRMLGNVGRQFLAMKQYDLPILTGATDEPVNVRIPWRSTAKHLQVRWNGVLEGEIIGKVRLASQSYFRRPIEGQLTNATPWDLDDVYLIWQSAPRSGAAAKDHVLYLPGWRRGDRIDLGDVFAGEVYAIGQNAMQRESVPRQGKIVYGAIESVHRGFGNQVAMGEGWAGFWYSLPTPGFGAVTEIDDSHRRYISSLPLASLIDRVPPMRNRQENNTFVQTRVDLLRIGARQWNVSPAIAAGNLVIIARAQGQLPMPLQVEGEHVEGEGTIFYQAVLPLSRPDAAEASQPSAAPSVSVESKER